MSENRESREGRRPGRPSSKQDPDFIRMELRLHPDLHRQLRAMADADERSLHAYITRVLRDHAGRAGGQP